MSTESKDIRNVIVLGHSGSGKTTLVEHLLFAGGGVTKAGSVDKGDTVSDYNEDEIERKISINSSISHIISNNTKINLIDTPGFNDFIGEVIGGLRAADAAIVVVNGVSGVEVGTERYFKMAKNAGIPIALFVNRLDKELSDFSRTFDQCVKKFGKHCVAVTYPIGSTASLTGVADLLMKENFDKLDGAGKDEAQTMMESLTEDVAEVDDTLLEKFLEKGDLEQGEKTKAFKKAFLGGNIIPVFAGAASADIGVNSLLTSIVRSFPSPLDCKPVEAANLGTKEDVTLECNPTAPFAGQVFKTISDPYIGQISIMKVFSGTVASNAGGYNTVRSEKEKLGQIVLLNGKKDSPVDMLKAGDIGCITKLKNTHTGDTLCDEKHPVLFKPIDFPEPAISFSIKPKTRSDEDKISTALHKLTAEDNVFKINRDPQTREMIASGMGDLHLNIMVHRLRTRFGVQVDIGTPKVAYKETITSHADAQYRHKKQSGGAGQFGEVWLKVDPLSRGQGFEFVDDVVGGAIPGPFVVSCEKGIRASLDTGILAGFPIVDVKATVYDGKTHPVDSKDIAFQIAARHAFKDACQKARPVILEPIMDVDILVPDEYMGDVTGSLNQRRGRIMGMEPGEGAETIKAQVPLDEMYKYVNELKSITAGRGTYTMRFNHYEVVPSNIAQVIIANAAKHKQEEKEE